MYLWITDPDHNRHGETGRLVQEPDSSETSSETIFRLRFPDGTKTTALSSQVQVIPIDWRDLSA